MSTSNCQALYKLAWGRLRLLRTVGQPYLNPWPFVVFKREGSGEL